MKFRTMALASAALALAATPAIAEAAFERSVAPIEEANELSGTEILIGVLVTAAVVGGIVAATSDDDDDNPAST